MAPRLLMISSDSWIRNMDGTTGLALRRYLNARAVLRKFRWKMLHLRQLLRFRGRVVRQRSAKPSTAVRIRSEPQAKRLPWGRRFAIWIYAYLKMRILN